MQHRKNKHMGGAAVTLARHDDGCWMMLEIVVCVVCFVNQLYVWWLCEL